MVFVVQLLSAASVNDVPPIVSVLVVGTPVRKLLRTVMLAFLVVPPWTMGATSAPDTVVAAGNAEMGTSAANVAEAMRHIVNAMICFLLNDKGISCFCGDSVAAFCGDMVCFRRRREDERANDPVGVDGIFSDVCCEFM